MIKLELFNQRFAASLLGFFWPFLLRTWEDYGRVFHFFFHLFELWGQIVYYLLK
jgi:hypothetical protein